MSDVFFSSNPGDWTKLEGLYINEVPPPAFIQGADLSAVGLVGKCVRGRVDKPVYCASPTRFVEVFGGRDIVDTGVLEGEIWKALQGNAFGGIYVRRVAAVGAISANNSAHASATTLSVVANGPGTWGNGVTFSVEAASGGVTSSFDLRVKWRGREWLYRDLSINGTDNNLLTVIGDDDANPVIVSKTAAGRPVNVTDAPMTLGAQGTIAVTDYTTGLTDMAGSRAAYAVLIPESLEESVGAAAQATINGTVQTLANASNTKLFLTWSGKQANTKAQETTAINAQITTRSDRIVYCTNAVQITDPVTGAKIWQGAHVKAASIISQTDINVHLGVADNEKFLANAVGAQFESFDDAGVELKAFRDAGISALERRDAGPLGFHSAITTNKKSGRTEIARRRSVDFLIASASVRLKDFVRREDIEIQLPKIASELSAFSEDLKDGGRVVKSYVIDTTTGNSPTLMAQGVGQATWRVRLINHLLFLVLNIDAGTGVVTEVN